MGENNLASAAQPESCGETSQPPYETRTIRQAIQERREYLQRQWKELDDLERNLPGYFLEMKRKDFQGIYSVL